MTMNTIQHQHIEKIISFTAAYYNVDPIKMHLGGRLRLFALPRQISMWLARKMTTLSLAEIGGHYGDKDHTTVIHAVAKIKRLAIQDEMIAGQLRELERQFLVATKRPAVNDPVVAAEDQANEPAAIPNVDHDAPAESATSSTVAAAIAGDIEHRSRHTEERVAALRRTEAHPVRHRAERRPACDARVRGS